MMWILNIAFSNNTNNICDHVKGGSSSDKNNVTSTPYFSQLAFYLPFGGHQC